MTNFASALNSHLLIDGAMVADLHSIIPLAVGERPAWVNVIYKDEIAQYSPLVLDVQAAEQAGQIDTLMQLANALQPQLHLSIIDTTLSAADLAQCLRHFIFVRTTAGKDLTFRFADCAGLLGLHDYLSVAQWATFQQAAHRWQIHLRDGTLTTLPACDRETPLIATPMVLTTAQVAALEEAMLPDRMITRVLDMSATDELPGSPAEQHAWACAAYILWREAGNIRIRVLEALTNAVLSTRGVLLESVNLAALLTKDDTDEIEHGLAKLEAQILARKKMIAEKTIDTTA